MIQFVFFNTLHFSDVLRAHLHFPLPAARIFDQYLPGGYHLICIKEI